MGFYLRKSVRVGPFRFNLSNHGIGVSAGFKGFRVGTGPRGNYVHMGAGGIYYRATLPASTPPRSSAKTYPPATGRRISSEASPHIPDNTHDPLVEIDSGDVSKMVDSSSKDLLDELNRKQRAIRWGPIVFVLAVIGVASAYAIDWPLWAVVVLAGVSVVSIVWAYLYDALHKSVVLFYNFDEPMEAAYGALHACAQSMAACSGVWHVEAAGAVRDRKYHAGASQLVNRKRTQIGSAAPPFVKTNISTVFLKVGRQTLHFFPDRALVYDGNGVGAVSYADFLVDVTPSRFIEDESAPFDATVVGQTWRFVNKGGGPDRRFNNNRQLPICLYDEVFFTSKSGLKELVQFSKSGVAVAFASAVASLARMMPRETPSSLPSDASTSVRAPLQRRTLPTVEHAQDEFFNVKGKGAYRVQAVGESHYQPELRALTGGHVGVLECEAELFCEDDNPYDANAVKVIIRGKTVGYLAREVAPLYRQTVRNAGFGKATGKCRAKIFGGGKEKPFFGVWLDM